MILIIYIVFDLWIFCKPDMQNAQFSWILYMHLQCLFQHCRLEFNNLVVTDLLAHGVDMQACYDSFNKVSCYTNKKICNKRVDTTLQRTALSLQASYKSAIKFLQTCSIKPVRTIAKKSWWHLIISHAGLFQLVRIWACSTKQVLTD